MPEPCKFLISAEVETAYSRNPPVNPMNFCAK